MKLISSQAEIQIYQLDENLAEKYSSQICESLDQIPLVDKHTQEQLLATKKDTRILHHKFDHSLIALSGAQYVGVAIGYEREAEGNDQYPHHTLYLSDFAIASSYRKKGLGTMLLKTWLEFNLKVGFLQLPGKVSFSLQTNSAAWNKYVQDLYELVGFQKVAEKSYPNRVDTVYLLKI